VDYLVVEGGSVLEGTIQAAGAKNAVLPILAAALLTEETLRVENVPDLMDVRTMAGLLTALGAEVERDVAAGVLEARVPGTPKPHAPWDLVRKMRASFEVLGPLVARCGRAVVSYPGGCVFGVRPVDVHLKGLRALGAEVTVDEGNVVVEAPPGGLVGAEVYLGVPSGSSVGATRNVMMAATLARGRTVIQCAACEPEVVDLADCLVAMGARISGAGSPTITIDGVERLGGATHSVVADRIEVGTYLIAGALTGGRVRVEGCRPEHLASLVDAFWRADVALERGPDWLEVHGEPGHRPRPTDVATQPYPGFPTDLQAQWMSLMAMADGVSLVTDRIYTDRFMHVAELLRLGADMRRHGPSAVVCGVPRLSGAELMASDLRGSAALVLAGLVAEGRTAVHRVYHVDRGYERIEERLQALGASVTRLRE
jgi:UDP-N-acetylglucosamine 1-carboxyvinyltransferase